LMRRICGWIQEPKTSDLDFESGPFNRTPAPLRAAGQPSKGSRTLAMPPAPPRRRILRAARRSAKLRRSRGVAALGVPPMPRPDEQESIWRATT